MTKPKDPDPKITTNEQFTDRYLMGMLGQFLRPYTLQIIAVFVMLLGVTGFSLLMPYLIQRAVDGPIADGDLDGLIPYAVVYFVSIGILFALRFGHTYLLQTIGQNTLVSLRQTLFEHIMRQDMRFYNNTPVGQIVSRLSNDIDALTELLSTSIVVVVSNMITLIGIIVVMFLINWQLALLSLSVMPFMVFTTLFFRTRIRASSAKYHQTVARYLGFINEQFNGMLVVQLFGRQKDSLDEFDEINTAYRDVHTELRDFYTYYASILQILSPIGLGIVLYGGGQGVMAGWASLGMLISFIDYTRRSFEPILQLSEQISQIQTALAAGERIARTLQVQPSIDEPAQPKTIEKFTPTFTFDHVYFGYTPDQMVLKDVDFHIPSGQRVAIVGATGAGKTSLAGLLARFYDVNQGRVLIDGVDVRDLSLKDLRRFVSVVPQNPYCFNGTIADNLRLFDNSITEAQMKHAAQIANAAPFIERQPDGYNYKLLPGGSNLSQGQRQLLALARALIHNPNSILVLDEATSNIDTETEALIQVGLERVLENRTSLIIAHRLSTIRDADRILVMQRGQVVEDGNHTSLIAQGGYYARLYWRQFAQAGIDPNITGQPPQQSKQQPNT